ncbi:MAG: hypothetical protein KME27_19720 [Lyngbya sp. HA4199-MV5]|jgi:hypothetical protein|nr:hypothetical protein [Lyngbya sp. HA4199-MV5]
MRTISRSALVSLPEPEGAIGRDRHIAVRCTTNMFSHWAILTTTDLTTMGDLNGAARTTLGC